MDAWVSLTSYQIAKTFLTGQISILNSPNRSNVRICGCQALCCPVMDQQIVDSVHHPRHPGAGYSPATM